MSEAMTASIPVVAPEVSAPKLRMVGDTDVATCEGDVCEIPAHHEQAVMNRRVDSDLI